MLRYVMLFLVLIPFWAFGGGFEINTQGQRAMGMGGAFCGIASDASAIYFNPAGIAFQEHNLLTAGVNLVSSKTSFLSASEGNVDSENSIQIPFHLYASKHLNNRNWTAGLGIYTPYATSNKWDEKWTGRYIVQEMKLSTIFLQPTITYQMDDNLSVGLGVVGAWGNIKMKKALPVNDDLSMDIKGNGFGFGINAGIMAHYEYFNVGVNYKSGVKLTIDKGDASINNIPASLADQQLFPESATFTSSFSLPSKITIGIGYMPTDRITADLDVSYTTWKSFDDWNIEFADYKDLNSRHVRNYSNAFGIKLGGQYHWSDKMDYRIGAGYDGSPTTENNLYPDLPDGKKLTAAAGATRHINNKMSIDIALIIEDYAQQKETANEINFNGSYQKTVYTLGLGVYYEF